MMGEAFLDYAMNGRVAGLTGNRHAVHAPQGVYPCVGEDSWVAVSVRSDAEWHGLCDAMRRPDLAKRRAAGHRRRPARHTTPRSTWLLPRGRANAATTRPCTCFRLATCPRARCSRAERRLSTRTWRRGASGIPSITPRPGEYRQVTTPWRMSKSRRIHAAPAPGLGEHNAFVLGDLLGLPASELDALVRQGIIGTRPVGAD